jgi:hypothetical protein
MAFGCTPLCISILQIGASFLFGMIVGITINGMKNKKWKFWKETYFELKEYFKDPHNEQVDISRDEFDDIIKRVKK